MKDWPRDLPILISGPTASGKSGLAVELAQAVGGAVINADALQVYGCWQVLSARPTKAEMQGIPHHLYGHVGRGQPYSAGHWLRDVAGLLPVLRARDEVPVFVGGTGLYFSALTEGLAEIPEIEPAVRDRAVALSSSAVGVQAMLDDLEKEDPDTYAVLDRDNPMRVQRAWAVLQSTGQGLAAWQHWTPAPILSDFRGIVLSPDREWLADRIAQRFELMMTQGAVKEAELALSEGWDPNLPSSKAIGAGPLIAWLEGRLTRAEAVSLATIQSRQYAKRQRTWFRKRMKSWLNLNSSQDLSTEALLNRLISSPKP